MEELGEEWGHPEECGGSGPEEAWKLRKEMQFLVDVGWEVEEPHCLMGADLFLTT